MPYLELQKLINDANPWGFLNYWKAELLDELTDELIDLNLAHAVKAQAPLTASFFQPLGGALGRLPVEATAIDPRAGRWIVHALGVWETEAESDHEMAWVRQWGELIEPYARAGVPLTFTADTGDDRVRATFGDARYERLVALKDKYDPDNLFRLNQNIKPS
jgi:FAD/FMN-containing dehydrogenase